MFKTNCILRALEVAQENTQGFTIWHDMSEMPTSGYAVAYRETQDSHGITGFLRSLAFAIDNNTHFGGWLDKDTEKYYFDAVKVFEVGELKQAIAFAIQERQIAIFDITNGVEIRIQDAMGEVLPMWINKL